MSNQTNRIQQDHLDLDESLHLSKWTRSKYIKVLRVFLADIRPLNTVLGNLEQSDEKLGVVLDLTLADFNGDTPPTRFRYENFPNPNCLIQGATAMSLDSMCIMHARNALSYTDDGISFEDFGKDTRYSPLAMKHAQNYLRLTDNIKRNENVKGCFGYVRSEYSYINK